MVNADSIVQHVNQIKNGIICQCECKNYRTSQKIRVGVLTHEFVRMASI